MKYYLKNENSNAKNIIYLENKNIPNAFAKRNIFKLYNYLLT